MITENGREEGKKTITEMFRHKERCKDNDRPDNV